MSKISGYISRFIVLAIFLMASAVSHAAGAGVVVATTGDSFAISVTKQKRALKRGAVIETGDTLVTTAGSKLLIRMADNTAVAIHENTEYKVDQYKYDPANSSANVNRTSLVKGSMRVLTGVISKERPERFELRTPVAVIGVRGTEFSVSYSCVAAGNCRLMVLSRHGLVTVTNQGGSAALTAGRFVEVLNSKDPPKSKPAPSKNLCF